MKDRLDIRDLESVLERLAGEADPLARDAILFDAVWTSGAAAAAALWREAPAPATRTPRWQPVRSRGPRDELPSRAELEALADGRIDPDLYPTRRTWITGPRGARTGLALGGVCADEERLDCLEALVVAAACFHAGDSVAEPQAPSLAGGAAASARAEPTIEGRGSAELALPDERARAEVALPDASAPGAARIADVVRHAAAEHRERTLEEVLVEVDVACTRARVPEAAGAEALGALVCAAIEHVAAANALADTLAARARPLRVRLHAPAQARDELLLEVEPAERAARAQATARDASARHVRVKTSPGHEGPAAVLDEVVERAARVHARAWIETTHGSVRCVVAIPGRPM